MSPDNLDRRMRKYGKALAIVFVIALIGVVLVAINEDPGRTPSARLGSALVVTALPIAFVIGILTWITILRILIRRFRAMGRTDGDQ